jgi:pimeloyl-ACP methyl ester carboxylesterase
MFAVDLLGFGRSPKPADSLYTLREHLEMIERSVLQRYRLRSFHVVAHSLGSVLALALAVKYPDAVKSLTLLAPVSGSAVPTSTCTYMHALPMHSIAVRSSSRPTSTVH